MSKGNAGPAGKAGTKMIAQNKRARHEYFIEDTYEAGIMLEGWEAKSLREGRGQLTESYVAVEKGELFLQGCHISPLLSASTHVNPIATRSRKLLLHAKEIDSLIGGVERDGYTLMPLSLYWKGGRAKLAVALAKGKKLHDKRASIKERDWNRDKQRLLKER